MATGLRYVTARASASSCAWLAVLVSVSACAEQDARDVPREPVLLIDHAHWTTYSAQADPLSAHQPAAIACGPAGHYVETDSLELDSAFCNYALLSHPALVDVDAAAEISFELRHYDLTASEPTRAHLALIFDDVLAWEIWLDIPSPADALHISFLPPRALRRGAPIRLHFHNHGQNNYALGPVFAKLPIQHDY